MDESIRDIGRPRIRSSRPIPPSEEEKLWTERVAGEEPAVADGDETNPLEEKEVRH